MAGLRGAACTQGDRVKGQITRKLVQELVATIKQAEADNKRALTLHAKGSSRKDVITQLKKMRAQDQTLRRRQNPWLHVHKTAPHRRKSLQNIPQHQTSATHGLFPGSFQIEIEVINQLAHASSRKKLRGLFGFRRNRSQPDGAFSRKKHGAH